MFLVLFLTFCLQTFSVQFAVVVFNVGSWIITLPMFTMDRKIRNHGKIHCKTSWGQNMTNRRKYGGQECHILVSMEKRVLCITDNIRGGMKKTDVKESSFHLLFFAYGSYSLLNRGARWHKIERCLANLPWSIYAI